MEIKPFKIKVNPEQSRIVQKVVFKNGYTWQSGHQDISKTSECYLFFDNTLAYDDNSLDFFNDAEEPELTFKQFIEMYSDETHKDFKLKIESVTPIQAFKIKTNRGECASNYTRDEDGNWTSEYGNEFNHYELEEAYQEFLTNKQE